MRFTRGCIAACVLAVAVTLPSPVHATYPGNNGKISYDVHQSDNTSDIYTIDADGSDPTLLIENGRYSAWSLDGRRIAFTCNGYDTFYDNTCTAGADGTALTVLDSSGFPGPQYRPFWSPDAKRLIVDNRITFGHNPEEAYAELWRIDAADGGDHIRMAVNALSGSWSPNGRIAYSEFREHFAGTDRWVSTLNATTPNSGVRLTDSLRDASPDWSPDGTKIVFESCRDSCGIWVMNADGSGETRLHNGSDTGAIRDPVWSPDGTKILFDGGDDVWVMNADGTGQVNLTNTPTVFENDPAWQPVPQPGYPRPKRATPIRVPLVPAFDACTEPNRVHGPPMASDSCNPPRTLGQYAGFGPAFTGHVKLSVTPGTPPDPAWDVRVSASLTDVKRNSDSADAPQALDLTLTPRITDNATDPLEALDGTTADPFYETNPLHVDLPCSPTADPSLGSTCSVQTSFGALSGLSGERAVVELEKITVYDGGDGSVSTRDDNTPLAVQGVFVP